MKKYFIALTAFITVWFFLVTGVSFAKDSTFESGLKTTAIETGHLTSSSDKGGSIESMVQMVINAILSLLGVGFLVLMIYGGYIWMMAKGNESEVDKAKNIITNAIIGLIVVLSAYAISYFVISNFSNPTA